MTSPAGRQGGGNSLPDGGEAEGGGPEAAPALGRNGRGGGRMGAGDRPGP